MHDIIMSTKMRIIQFLTSTAGRDMWVACGLMILLSGTGAVMLAMPSDLPASVCGSSKTVFSSFAADRPC